MLMLVVATALLGVAIVLLFTTARRWRALGLALLAGAAIVLVLQLRTAFREVAQLKREITRRDALVDGYCKSLAFELLSDVGDFRVLSKGLDPLPVDALKLQNYYLNSLSERRVFAPMCIVDGSGEEWFTCIPEDLNEHTLAKIEQAAIAIRDHKRCGQGVQ